MGRSRSRGRRKSRSRSRSRRGGDVGGSRWSRRRSHSRRRRSPSRPRRPREEGKAKGDSASSEGVFSSMLAIKGGGGAAPAHGANLLPPSLLHPPSFLQQSFARLPPVADPGRVVQGNLAALGFTVQLPGHVASAAPAPPPVAPPPVAPFTTAFVVAQPLPALELQMPVATAMTLSSMMNSMAVHHPSKVGGMKICVSFMSIGRCSRQQTCPLKHQMDEKESVHWRALFARTPCRDGATCSCLPQCVYLHPPEHRALKQARLMEPGFCTQRQAEIALGGHGHAASFAPGASYQPPPPPPSMPPPPPLHGRGPSMYQAPQHFDAQLPMSLQDAAEKELYASLAGANVL